MSIPPWFDDRPLEDIREDLLGFAAPARRLAGRLDRFWHPSRGHALAVSLEGPWGSGKTSFTNMVIQTLRQSSAKGPPVVVRFNVWQSGSMALTEWSALAYRIGEAIYTEIHRRCRQNIAAGEPRLSVLPPSLVARRLGPLERAGAALEIDCSGLEDPRLHWIEVATRIADAVPAEHWHPALALFCDQRTDLAVRGPPPAHGGHLRPARRRRGRGRRPRRHAGLRSAHPHERRDGLRRQKPRHGAGGDRVVRPSHPADLPRRLASGALSRWSAAALCNRRSSRILCPRILTEDDR